MKKQIKKKKLNGIKADVNGSWVATSEKMPEIGKNVIGYFPRKTEGGRYISTAISWDGKTLISNFPNSTAHCFEATHWMEFPEPPNLR